MRGRAGWEQPNHLGWLMTRLRTRRLSAPRSSEDYIGIPSPNGWSRLPVADILWVKGERDYVRLHTRRGSYLLHGRMKDMESRLKGEGMMRVHRSAIVRLDAIARIETVGARSYRLILDNGDVVRASASLGARFQSLS